MKIHSQEVKGCYYSICTRSSGGDKEFGCNMQKETFILIVIFSPGFNSLGSFLQLCPRHSLVKLVSDLCPVTGGHGQGLVQDGGEDRRDATTHNYNKRNQRFNKLQRFYDIRCETFRKGQCCMFRSHLMGKGSSILALVRITLLGILHFYDIIMVLNCVYQ